MKSCEHRHIAVEGCVGVGKTTLATKLAELRGAHLVLEQFEKNPFLPEFYKDPTRHVFETEMQFLLLHYHQLKGVGQAGTGETITDFSFFKDLVFAKANLVGAGEERMFLELYEFLLARLSAPHLIIYLKGSDDLIIERIRKRNRSMEMEIDVAYFKKLRRAYDKFFTACKERVHVIDADKFDCLNGSKALEKVSGTIDSLLGREVAA